MKKTIAIVFTILLVMIMSSCGRSTSTSGEVPQSQTTQILEDIEDGNIVDSRESTDAEPSLEENKILIAYFSRANNIDFDESVDAVTSASINISGDGIDGNARLLALICQEATGGDLFSIETVEKYPTSYDDTMDVAEQEQNDNVRPALSTHVKNMDNYNAVIVIFPNWLGMLPQPVVTFLEEYDFSSKMILPLCTHEGSGLGRSEETIASICPDAQLFEGLAVRGSSVGNAEEEVEEWLRNSGIKK